MRCVCVIVLERVALQLTLPSADADAHRCSPRLQACVVCGPGPAFKCQQVLQGPSYPRAD